MIMIVTGAACAAAGITCWGTAARLGDRPWVLIPLGWVLAFGGAAVITARLLA